MKTKTASRAATETAMFGGEMGTSYRSVPVEGWHNLTKEGEAPRDFAEWLDVFRSYEEMSCWIADEDDEWDMAGNFDDRVNLKPSDGEAVYKPHHFTEDELRKIHAQIVESWDE